MDASLSSLFNFYDFSTGRRLFALSQVQKLAKDHAFAELSTHTATAIQHDKRTHELDLKWSEIPGAAVGSKTTKKLSKIQRIDAKVDRTLTALRDAAVAQIDGAEPDDAIHLQVDGFLRAIFPAGVQAVTGLSFVDELNAVDAIVDKLNGSHAGAVAELGLTRIAKRLATLAVEYRAAQEAPSEEELSFGTVRAARAKGQEHLLQAVALIVGKYHSSADEHVAARSALLAPILKQNEAIRLYLRSRRAVEDVDPETGEVDPSAPNSGEPPPAGAV
jgi:hypothetical protein